MRPLPLGLGLAVLATLSCVSAQAPICPDSVAMERCLENFDRDGDHALDLAEFEAALDSASWGSRWMLHSAETYMKRCDADKNGSVSGMELLSSGCLSTCAEQRLLYITIC
jgi:Ca2+-binding EF-hand superfamily protein